MLVLDTDTLSLLAVGHPRVTSRRETIAAKDLAITIVTRIEVLRGRFEFLLKAADGAQLLKAQHLLEKTEHFLASVRTILPVTVDAAATFDRLRQLRKLRSVGRADLLIAAIALVHRSTLITRNVKHFHHVPGLRLENWAD